MSLNLNQEYTPEAVAKIDVDQSDVKAALNARTALYAIAILNIFGAILIGFVAGNRMENPALVVVPTLVAGVFYIVCGYFAGKLHIWAFVAGLAVYALDTVLVIYTFASEGGRSYSLILKAVILYYLVKGLFAAVRVKEAVDSSRL